jgi:putative hydrolase of the HAD superfamily
MIKAVIFDLDDTLFPEHEFVLSGFQAVSSWVATQYSILGFFEVAWQLFKEGKRNRIFNFTLEKLRVEYEPWMIQELVHIYRQHKPMISLHEDAKWAINHFKNQDKQLGIITDGYLTTQQNKVEALGIEPDFDAIIYSDLYGRENWKPSPVPYNKIMRSIRCQGKECVYVADNPHKDFVTAKSLNWRTVQICREGGEYSKITPEKSHDANFKIKSLLELKNIL